VLEGKLGREWVPRRFPPPRKIYNTMPEFPFILGRRRGWVFRSRPYRRKREASPKIERRKGRVSGRKRHEK